MRPLDDESQARRSFTAYYCDCCSWLPKSVCGLLKEKRTATCLALNNWDFIHRHKWVWDGFPDPILANPSSLRLDFYTHRQTIKYFENTLSRTQFSLWMEIHSERSWCRQVTQREGSKGHDAGHATPRENNRSTRIIQLLLTRGKVIASSFKNTLHIQLCHHGRGVKVKVKMLNSDLPQVLLSPSIDSTLNSVSVRVRKRPAERLHCPLVVNSVTFIQFHQSTLQ